MKTPDNDKMPTADSPSVVRLFPLPNLVMFPGAMQLLNIFEPRYRELLEESLAGDRTIAMAVLLPGYEAEYEGRPPVSSVVCQGRVAGHRRLDDGQHNILLVGQSRMKLVRELEPNKSFREAVAVPAFDVYPPNGEPGRAVLRSQLHELLDQAVPQVAQAHEELDQLFTGSASLGSLTDLLAYALPLDIGRKQELLEETDVDRRARVLLDDLRTLAGSDPASPIVWPSFPPDFSEN